MNDKQLDKDEYSGEISDISHSKSNIISYGLGDFVMQVFAIAFGAYVFYFYEAEIGLDSWLTALGFIIYGIWNAVNDPLVGFICDRPFFFTKKWGRRFPWIISSMIPSILIYVLLYSPPNVDPVGGQWILFGWLVFSTCLFDTAVSFWGVNFGALYADKFRNLDERRTASGIIMILGYFGIATGSLLPPLLIHYGVKESYVDQAWALVFVALIAAVFIIPGIREDQQTIDRYLKAHEHQKERGEKTSMIEVLKSTFKQKNFIAYISLFLGYNVLRACMLGSLQYGLRYILKLPAIFSTIIMGAYLVSSLLSIPIWAIIIKKINNNRKTIIIGAIMSCIFTFPMTFLADLISWVIVLVLWGIGIAGLFVASRPVFADIIDESVVKTGKRNEGVYSGLNMFILRFSIVFQAIIFALVHDLTGFVGGVDTQSELAIWGIHLTLGLIPMLFMFLGTLIFWRLYDLTPMKVEKNKMKLKELEL